MQTRRLTILPLAAASPRGKALVFGEDFGGRAEREAGRGLALEMARAARELPGVEARVGCEEDIASALGANGEALLDLLRPGADGSAAADLIGRLAGEADYLIAGQISLRPDAVWRLQAFDASTGELVGRENIPFREARAADALEAILNAPAALLKGPWSGTRPASMPTPSAEAYVHYCAGLGATSRLAAAPSQDFEPLARLGFGSLLAALAADAEFAPAATALERLAEACLARPDLPRPLIRESLDEALAGGCARPAILRLRGLVEYDMERHRRAMAWFRRAMAEGDAVETCAYYLAKCAEALGDWEEMAGWTARLKRARPGDAASHLIDGVAAMRTNRSQDAIASWREALALDPSLSSARANIALALLEEGRSEEALAEIEGELEAGCPSWEFAHVAALALCEAGDPDRARALVEEFLGSRHVSASGLVEAARVFAKVDEPERAREILEEAMMLAPSSEAADAAGRMLCEMEEPGFARAFQRAAEAALARESPEDLERLEAWTRKFSFSWRLWFIQGMALWQNDLPAKARVCLERARALRPDHPDVLCKLSSLLLELGYLPEARARGEEALASSPEKAELHSQCALVLAYERDFRGAARHLREAARIDPSDRLLALARALVRKIQTRPDFPLPRRGRLPIHLLREPSDRRDMQGIAESQIVRLEHRRAAGPRRLGGRSQREASAEGAASSLPGGAAVAAAVAHSPSSSTPSASAAAVPGEVPPGSAPRGLRAVLAAFMAGLRRALLPRRQAP
jgi:tetratricopeptide (TPR) repeat protein